MVATAETGRALERRQRVAGGTLVEGRHVGLDQGRIAELAYGHRDAIGDLPEPPGGGLGRPR